MVYRYTVYKNFRKLSKLRVLRKILSQIKVPMAISMVCHPICLDKQIRLTLEASDGLHFDGSSVFLSYWSIWETHRWSDSALPNQAYILEGYLFGRFSLIVPSKSIGSGGKLRSVT